MRPSQFVVFVQSPILSPLKAFEKSILIGISLQDEEEKKKLIFNLSDRVLLIRIISTRIFYSKALNDSHSGLH